MKHGSDQVAITFQIRVNDGTWPYVNTAYSKGLEYRSTRRLRLSDPSKFGALEVGNSEIPCFSLGSQTCSDGGVFRVKLRPVPLNQ